MNDVIYHWKAFFLIYAMQNIPSELIITVKNYINITSFKMKGSPDLGKAVIYKINVLKIFDLLISKLFQKLENWALVNRLTMPVG